jgi:Lipoate synthase
MLPTAADRIQRESVHPRAPPVINSREFKHAVPAVEGGVKRRDAQPAPRERKPDWLRVQLPTGGRYQEMKRNVTGNRLATV